MRNTKIALITAILAIFGFYGINAKASTVGLWLFDEGTGNTVRDSSVNNNNGTIYGGATWSTDTPFSYPGNYALSFDGSNDYIKIPPSSSLNLTNAFTFEAWVKLKSTGFRYIGDKYHTYGLKIQDNKLYPRGFVKVGRKIYEVTSSKQIALNTWVHLATTYNGEVLKIYVNGEPTEKVFLTGNISSTGSSLFIGRYGGGGYNFFGLIDEVRISDEALSPEQLGCHKSLAVIPEPTSLSLLTIGLLGLLRKYSRRKSA
ncbi:MAG: hypothetical protein DRP76_03130 [Candidatus Omnitrophota bacterium]|mgnify:CR=1 FL=1|nr:MAG: hypothetical protein DRP76_03130 [Candidatus Omnitrophota bacterium]